MKTLAERLSEDCGNPTSSERLHRATWLARESLAAPQSLIVSLANGAASVVARSVCGREGWLDERIISFCQTTAASLQPLVRGDLETSSHIGREARCTRAFIGVPLGLDGGALGVLCAADVVQRAWCSSDVADLVEIAAAVSEDQARPRNATILLADDLDLNRKLIADMLSLEGYSVDCVADGAEAVRAAAARPYDLVLMDMVMPGMDGVAATRAIRALPCANAGVPIIALTANAFQEHLDLCIHAGMNAALTKPISLEVLTGCVARWARGPNEAGRPSERK